MIRGGQVHRAHAGGTGPRHIEAAITPPTQHEDALAAGNHEVKTPVAVQIARLDAGGRASRNGVDPIDREWTTHNNIVDNQIVVYSLSESRTTPTQGKS